MAVEPELLNELVRVGRKRQLFEPNDTPRLALGHTQIERLIPHRDPFLFIDQVTALDRIGQTIVGSRHIDPADPVFRGHFPGDPIYPGVLQLEMMGQLGLCLLALVGDARSAPGDGSRAARALKVHYAVFVTAIQPNDDLIVLAKLIEADDVTGICAGQIVKGDAVCSFGVMEVYFAQD